MMKHEFEERIGTEVSNCDYAIIETVYTWHPSISEVDGKEQITALYKTGGMALIKSMVEAAKIMRDLRAERQHIMGQLEKVNDRIKLVSSGELKEEQCRKDAIEMFEKSDTPEEWLWAEKFLTTKYGKELASEIIKEVEK